MGSGASNAKYEFAGEGPRDFDFEECHACFKEDNGLLFRLTNFETEQWAFYNDTKNKEFHIRVVFHGSAQIRRLGNTLLEQGGSWDNGGSSDENFSSYVATLVVYAGQTEPFIEGYVNGFKATYEMARLSSAGKKYIKRKEKEGGRTIDTSSRRGDEDSEYESDAESVTSGVTGPNETVTASEALSRRSSVSFRD